MTLVVLDSVSYVRQAQPEKHMNEMALKKDRISPDWYFNVEILHSL